MSIPDKTGFYQDEFEEDGDVEYVESADCSKRLYGFLIRLVISLFFIGCLSGALIWSFNNGETGTNTNETHRDASKNFSIFIDQYSKKEGEYILTYRYPEGTHDDEEPKTERHESFWIQSNTNQSLVHQISPVLTIYAFEKHSYWYDTSAETPTCTFDKNTTYMSYIRNLGMTVLERQHSEFEETHNNEKVFVYQGNPNEVLSSNINQKAFLVTAYADAKTGALIAWDTYFTADDNASETVYEVSYEYETMTPAKPDDSWFNTPAECAPTL